MLYQAFHMIGNDGVYSSVPGQNTKQIAEINVTAYLNGFRGLYVYMRSANDKLGHMRMGGAPIPTERRSAIR